MKSFVSVTCAIALIGVSNLAAAQGKGGPKVKPAHATTHAPTTKPVSSKPMTTKSPTSKAATGKPTTTATTKSHGSARVKTADAKTTGHAKTATSAAGTTTTTTTATPAGTTIPLTPVQQKLAKNSNLASKLQSRLPAGTNLNAAAADFRNLGQFVAAVNVSHNLGLDFTTLKTAMVTDGKSLGQAIQAQKGTTVNATVEADRAQRDADSLIRTTEKAPKQKKGTNGQP